MTHSEHPTYTPDPAVLFTLADKCHARAEAEKQTLGTNGCATYLQALGDRYEALGSELEQPAPEMPDKDYPHTRALLDAQPDWPVLAVVALLAGIVTFAATFAVLYIFAL